MATATAHCPATPSSSVPFPRREWSSATFGVPQFNCPGVTANEITWGCKKATVALISIVDGQSTWRAAVEPPTLVLLALCDSALLMNDNARCPNPWRPRPRTHEAWYNERLLDIDKLYEAAKDLIPAPALPSLDLFKSTALNALHMGWFPGVDAYEFLPAAIQPTFPRSTFASYAPGPSDAAAYGFSIWEGSVDPSTEEDLVEQAARLAKEHGFAGQRRAAPPVSLLHGLPPIHPPSPPAQLRGYRRVV